MYIIPLEHEDCSAMERLHYEVEAFADLLGRFASIDPPPANAEEILHKYFLEYSDLYRKYNQEKSRLEQKYKTDPADSWEIDFQKEVMVFK